MIPPFEYYSPVVLYTLARFSRWDDLLKAPRPEADLKYTTGVWHYGRGLAFAAKGALDSAAIERDSLAAIAAAIPPEAVANLNSMRALLQVGEQHLTAELAAGRKQTDEAVRSPSRGHCHRGRAHLRRAHRLGVAAAPAAGRATARRRPREAGGGAYREDLVRYPNNGWSLHGLAESLKAQGRTKEAAAIDAQFRKAWARADVKPLAAAY